MELRGTVAMCEQCLKNLETLLPDNMPWDERVAVLWNNTAFPAGSADTIERQLKEYSEKQVS